MSVWLKDGNVNDVVIVPVNVQHFLRINHYHILVICLIWVYHLNGLKMEMEIHAIL